MEPRILLETLVVAERLKDTTRHCYTRKGRHESVAEHCWMMTLMAYFVRDEFPEADMDKVIRMCLIHDLGEAFTGDIPSFDKTAENEKTEEKLLRDWVDTLPEFYREEMTALYGEMEKRETLEAKIYKAIDNLEAVIQHNISDLATWIPKEYELNKTYGDDKVAFSEYLRDLRAEVRRDTERKLGERHGYRVFHWRSGRDSNPRAAFDDNTISSRARYDLFDTTAYSLLLRTAKFIIPNFWRLSTHISQNLKEFMSRMFRKTPCP